MKKKSCIEMWMVSVILCVILHAILCIAQCNQLVARTDCVCPGRSVTYECSVMGGIFTVYSGSAFLCPGGDITLRNDQFGTGNSIGACDSGQISISGRGLMEVDNCYTSQVNISLGETVSQSTVSCSIEDDLLQVTLIDTAELVPSRDAFPPPSDLSLSAASSTYLTFTWNPVSGSCPSLVYNILADNCGMCPNKTFTNSINCTADFSTLLSQNGPMTCMLSVQTVICDGTSAPIAGNNITSMQYTLKVPSSPSLNITPYYDASTELIGYDAIVVLSDPLLVVISDSVDGSTTSFTLTDNCNLPTTIQVSFESCVDLVCRHHLRTKCSGETTNVAVYASNVLGNGSSSAIKRIDNGNNFVDIVFDVEVNPKEVKCVFLEKSQLEKTCTINLSFEDGLPSLTESGRTSNNIVTITLDRLPEGSIAFYNITASDGTYQLIEQGRFQVPRTGMDVNVGGIVAGTLVTLVLLSVVVPIVVSLCIIIITWLTRDYWWKRKGFITLQSEDCKSEKVVEDKTTEDYGKEVVDEEYVQLLQEVYHEVAGGDKLPEDVKLIVKHKVNGIYRAIDSDVAADKFVDEERKIRSPEKRNAEFRDYDVYVGHKSNTKVSAGTELLHCSNNPVTKDVLSEVHAIPVPPLKPGVEEVNHWFETIKIKGEVDLFEETTTKKRLKEIRPAIYKTKYYHEVGLYCTFEQGKTLTTDVKPKRIVMAVSNDHQLKLVSEEEKHHIPPDWDMYLEALGDQKLNAGSKVLVYNPRLERVNIHYELIMVRGSEPVEVLSFVRQKIKNSMLEHIYLQRDTNNIKDTNDWKFMALKKNDNLFTGSTISDAKAKGYEWRFVFFQVRDSNKVVSPGTMLLYCTK